MSMSKKDFIALADTVREIQGDAWRLLPNNPDCVQFMNELTNRLAGFCSDQNPRFMRDRWLDYIAGKCGPNGGGLKTVAYEVQGNYGQGFETVCTEDNRKEAMVRLREYRENEPQYSHRIHRTVEVAS